MNVDFYSAAAISILYTALIFLIAGYAHYRKEAARIGMRKERCAIFD